MLVRKNILCVDDDDNHNEILITFFEKSGFNVFTCNTPEECLRHIKTIEFSAIILDSWLENTIGVEVFQLIKSIYSETPLIFFTSGGRTKSREIAMTIVASSHLRIPDESGNTPSTVDHLINFSNFPLLPLSTQP